IPEVPSPVPPRDFIYPFDDQWKQSPGIHYAFHGFYMHSLPKIHTYSTPHAIANFRGLDIPSLYYEDPALSTVPAFWIDNSERSYFPQHEHPYFTGWCQKLLARSSRRAGVPTQPLPGMQE